MALYLQYNKAAKLKELLTGIKEFLNISLDNFVTDWFNIDTCNGLALDNWGLILNTNRYVPITNYDYILGFYEVGVPTNNQDYPQNFGNGTSTVFNNNNSTTGGTFYNDDDSYYQRLANTPYRMYLKFVYAKMTCNMSVAALVSTINTYFYFSALAEGNTQNYVTITEPSNMNILLTFANPIYAYEYTIFTQRKAMNIPAGVNATISALIIT